MLAEMARQAVDPVVKLDQRTESAVRTRDAGLHHLVLQFQRVGEIAAGEKIGKALQHILAEIERLADFAHGAAAAIGDDVGGHGRAVPAVAAEDFLDDLLAPVAAGQIEIDVGPALAAFAQETLEEKFAARSDRRP